MSSDSTLTLFIPDLFGFQSTLSQLSQQELAQLPGTRFPVLEKWLSRGRFIKSEKHKDILSSEFGLHTDDNQDKPFAALSLLAENNTQAVNKDKYWLRADPVYLYADRDTVLLSAHEELALSQEEADKLVEKINTHFKDEPWELFSVAPHRWYLALDKKADMQTQPLKNVIGKNVHHYRAVGEDSGYWQTITNEIQMLLHNTDVNFERESRGRITANSLWLWGGGELPEVKQPDARHDVIISNDILYTGAGYHYGLEVFTFDNDFMRLIQDKNSFVVIDMLQESITRLDVYQFMQVLSEIENTILTKCNALLMNNKIAVINLVTENATSITVTKKQLRHWWKRVKPFSSFNYA